MALSQERMEEIADLFCDHLQIDESTAPEAVFERFQKTVPEWQLVAQRIGVEPLELCEFQLRLITIWMQ